MQNSQSCLFCNAPLLEVETTKTGKKLQRCSQSRWNPITRQTEGCLYVLWHDEKKKLLKELCPKCGNPLIRVVTKSRKKLKKCSTAGWDNENLVATGCDYVEWIGEKRKELTENCPRCDAPLVEVTIKGKRVKKCSTAGWDSEFRQPIGCTYIEWGK